MLQQISETISASELLRDVNWSKFCDVSGRVVGRNGDVPKRRSSTKHLMLTCIAEKAQNLVNVSLFHLRGPIESGVTFRSFLDSAMHSCSAEFVFLVSRLQCVVG